MSQRMQGKAVMVTGAGTAGGGVGNGKACAILYAREGASVIAADIDAAAAEQTREDIVAEGGRCVAVHADVSQSADCRRIVDTCIEAFGRLDILHNNVGITAAGGPVEFDEEAWDRLMGVNVKSMFLMAKHTLPHMVRARCGSIVNIASIGAVRASPFPRAAYAASKGAVVSLTREIAVQYAAQGIRCNVILPGLIRAPVVEHNDVKLYGGDSTDMWRKRDAMSPTGKQGEPWDIAYASLFLASDESKYVNGVVLPVDGGIVNTIKL